jgi:hypothetical protein
MWFSSVPPCKCYERTSNWPRPLPFTLSTSLFSNHPTNNIVKQTRNKQTVGFEVLTAVVMKSSVFWDKTPCSLVKVNWCFGETYRLHLQGRRVKQARNQHEAGWRGRLYVPPKHQLTLTRLHGIISQKTELFKQTSCLQRLSKLLQRLSLLWMFNSEQQY